MCEYCENGKLMYPSVADDRLDYMEIFIENDRMIIMLGNEDAVVKINACPMCGRELRGDAE
jgi:hypothetical protein